jgi:hypothetical protein
MAGKEARASQYRLTCKASDFTAVEKSFFMEEDLTISARDE